MRFDRRVHGLCQCADAAAQFAEAGAAVAGLMLSTRVRSLRGIARPAASASHLPAQRHDLRLLRSGRRGQQLQRACCFASARRVPRAC